MLLALSRNPKASMKTFCYCSAREPVPPAAGGDPGRAARARASRRCSSQAPGLSPPGLRPTSAAPRVWRGELPRQRGADGARRAPAGAAWNPATAGTTKVHGFPAVGEGRPAGGPTHGRAPPARPALAAPLHRPRRAHARPHRARRGAEGAPLGPPALRLRAAARKGAISTGIAARPALAAARRGRKAVLGPHDNDPVLARQQHLPWLAALELSHVLWRVEGGGWRRRRNRWLCRRRRRPKPGWPRRKGCQRQAEASRGEQGTAAP
jgi:hypothetical protein